MASTVIASFEELIDALRRLPRRRSTLLVAIDGRGGSGKSTFARVLKGLATGARVVQMDDFFLPSAERIDGPEGAAMIGKDFDWRRVAAQVLEPLAEDRAARYQRYDWDKDELAEWHEISPGGIVVVEGVYSSRAELSPAYDFRIWVDSPRDVRLARGLARDGEDARDRWENDWMPAEDRYVEGHRPMDAADLLVDGAAPLGDRIDTHYHRIVKKP